MLNKFIANWLIGILVLIVRSSIASGFKLMNDIESGLLVC
jgi:hypothetical protein